MISNYTKVFSISIYHTYFNDQNDTIELNPSNDTKRLINLYGLKLIKNQNSFHFYDQSDKGFNQLLEHINQTNAIDAFKFDIISSDPNFYNYTKLPVDFIGHILYSSSNVVKHNDSIELQPQFILDSNSHKIGEVHLKFSDLKSESPISFDIKFETRSTYWQYNILINNHQLNNRDLHIDSHTNDIEFTKSEKRLINNNEAQVLTSKTLIPFHETQTHKFDLISKENDQKIIFSGLPMANPGQITIIENDEETVIFSQMYIYI